MSLIFLGKVIKTRGNKGEVVITPSPTLGLYHLNQGEMVVLKSTKYTKEIKLDYFKEIRGAPVFKFTGINSINEALRLVGYSIYGLQTPPPETQTDHISQLLDFTVKDLEGAVWGQVIHIEDPGYNPLLEVETPEGEIIQVPAVDSIITKIDQKEKIITIHPPEGLKDLNK